MVKLRAKALWGGAIGLILLATATDALAGQSFTAEAVETQPGQPTETGFVRYADQGMRFEFTRRDHPVVQIFLPSQGLMRVLFPDDKTYFEFQGPLANSRPGEAKPDTPCSTPEQARCERIGSDFVDGIAAEIWRVTPLPQPSTPNAPVALPEDPIDIWWDKARKISLREKSSGGASSQVRLMGHRQHGGRSVDVWETTTTSATGQIRRTVRWHDPELDIDVHEEHPNGAVRDLRNIVITKSDSSWFALPSDFRRMEPPTTSETPGASDNSQSVGKTPRNHP